MMGSGVRFPSTAPHGINQNLMIKRPNIAYSKTTALFMAVIMVALVVKSLIPVGFMPALGQNGMVDIVICSGMGEKTISVASDFGDAPPHSKTENQCPFNILTSAKLFFSAPAILIIPMAFITAPIVGAYQTFVSSFKISALFARGPPLLRLI